MDSDRLNRWLALGANLGVLIGLVVLIAEIGQNTEMMRAQMLDSRIQSQANRRNETFADDLLRVEAKLKSEGRWPVSEENVQELTALEREVLSNRLAVMLITTGNSYYQCQQGFLDKETCDAILTSISPRLILAMKALGRSMRNHRASFIEEVRRISREAGIVEINKDGSWD